MYALEIAYIVILIYGWWNYSCMQFLGIWSCFFFFLLCVYFSGRKWSFLKGKSCCFPFLRFFIYLNSIFGGFSGFWFFRNFFFGSQRLKSWRIPWLRARFWMENLRFTREKRFYQKLHKKGRLWLIKSSFHWIFARKTFYLIFGGISPPITQNS